MTLGKGWMGSSQPVNSPVRKLAAGKKLGLLGLEKGKNPNPRTWL